MNVHSGTIQDGKKVETTHTSITWWMDKEMWCRNTMECYSAAKKEQTTDTGYNMGKPGNQLAQWGTPDTKSCESRDSIYMECLEQASPRSHKAHQRLPRAHENGGWGALMRVGFPSEARKKVLKVVMVVSAQHCECTQCHWLAFFEKFKTVHFTNILLQSNLKMIKLIYGVVKSG